MRAKELYSPPASPTLTTASAEKQPMPLNVAFLTTATIATAGSFALGIKGATFLSGLLFFPFALGPLVVTVILSFVLRSRPAQAVLTVSSLLYGGWFGYAYADIFYLNPDPQSAIAILFIGIFAVPVLVIFWIAAFVLES